MVKIDKIVKKIKKIIGEFKPQIAIILGSGLSDACPDMKIYKEILYSEIGLPKSIVKGHIDSFIFGEYKGINIVKLSRFHYYESGAMNKVSLPFDILNALEIKDLILATATGGISDVKVGDIVLIKDHINFAPNPLIGRKDQYFVDMFNAYDKVYRNVVKEISIEKNVDLKEGIHIQVTGPSYETLAEVAMFKELGADTVSMSLATDVILSRFYNIRVLCFAVVCNKAGTKVKHEDILSKSKQASKNLKILISKFIDNKFNLR